MTPSSALGLSLDHRAAQPERNIDAAAQDVQAAITAAAPQLPGTDAPSYKKEPGRPARPVSGASRRPCRYTVDEYARPTWRSAFPRSPAWPRCRSSARRARCASSRPERARQPRHRIDEVQKALAQPNVNLSPARCTAVLGLQRPATGQPHAVPTGRLTSPIARLARSPEQLGRAQRRPTRSRAGTTTTGR